jgi:hypothetical protein
VKLEDHLVSSCTTGCCTLTTLTIGVGVELRSTEVLLKPMVTLSAGGLNKEALRVSAESRGTKDSLDEGNFGGNIVMNNY